MFFGAFSFGENSFLHFNIFIEQFLLLSGILFYIKHLEHFVLARVLLFSKEDCFCRTFHIRTTILPSEEDMPEVMDKFKKFNDRFMAQYEGTVSRL